MTEKQAMTEEQAIAHARSFTKSWLLTSMQNNLRIICSRFPEVCGYCEEIDRLIEVIKTKVTMHPVATIKPWVTPVKKS